MSRSRAALLFTLAATVVAPQVAFATWIPTNFGNGADVELRESAPTDNRGASTELGVRVAPGFRNSALLLRFDLSEITAAPDLESALRLTYRNSNLTESRIQDTETPDPDRHPALQIYGLDPTAPGAAWDESTVTYATAPGLDFDGDTATKDFNSDALFLGTVEFPGIGTQNHLPVGGELIFASTLLDQFVADALDDGFSEVTLLAGLVHGSDAPTGWINFNYLFNSKEQLFLNDDPTYDADIGDPSNPLGSPFSGAANRGLFSPALWIDFARPIPESGTLSLLILGLVALRLSRRRLS